MTTGRLLTARQVADTLGVSPETVLRYVRKGALQAVRLPGGTLRFREADLEVWLESRMTGADRVGMTSAPAPLERPGAWPQGD